jgi:hypothetical protein
MPMVNANSKKYETSRVNNVTDKQDTRTSEPVYEDTNVGPVANLSPYHHLNW